MESKKLALLCRDLADNKKAENTVILDVRNLSSITDYFVITSGGTEPHLRAIAHAITDGLREGHGVAPRAVEGEVNTPWQVVDYFDVIVHVMRTDVRAKYNLEGLWGDAGMVPPPRKKASPQKTKAKIKTKSKTKSVAKPTTKRKKKPDSTG